MAEKCVTGFFFLASLLLFVVNVEAAPQDQAYVQSTSTEVVKRINE